MAKISARGDSGYMRWRRYDGWELLLTKQGRLLVKRGKGEGWKLLRRKATEGEAGAQAAMYRMRIA